MQPDLFDRALGDAGRDQGIATATAHAEAVHEGWGDAAVLRAIAYLTGKPGRIFHCPQLRGELEAEGCPRPPSAFAWGGVMLRLSRAGVIEPAGYTSFGDATMHTQTIRLWRVRG